MFTTVRTLIIQLMLLLDIPKGSFQEFLGDNNEDGVVDLYDAINVAKLILPTVNGDWTKVSNDYQNWIKT